MALKDALAKISRKLKSAKSVRIGFLEGRTYPDGTGVPFVAAMNEYGHGVGANPGAGNPDTRQWVPPRPFFRNMVKTNSPDWGAGIAMQLRENNYDAKAALTATGEAIRGQLVEAIEEYDDGPPLSAATIARKGHAKQLVDTGLMLNSPEFEVDE